MMKTLSNPGVCVSFKRAKKSHRLPVNNVQGEHGRDCYGEKKPIADGSVLS